jgi:hypothetical protein
MPKPKLPDDTIEENPIRKLGGLSAELIVAAQLVEYGWNIYSPHRDLGFDFIATLPLAGGKVLIRPVQVRGRFPEKMTDAPYLGKLKVELSQWDDEMVLAMPFFRTDDGTQKLVSVAFMPFHQLRPKANADKQWFSCHPAKIKDGEILPRPYFKKFFDGHGIQLMAKPGWKKTKVGK